MREIKRIHYHHADGVALGGRISRPFEDVIPQPASLSLAPVGGYATARSEAFAYREIISFNAAHSEVAGTTSKPDGPWTTLVSTTIEGLNVLNVVTADRVVARVSTTHPAEGYIPKVSFVGTQFENLRIAGKEIKPQLDLDLCLQGDGKTYPSKPVIEDQAFLDRVNRQRAPFLEQKRTLGDKVSSFVSRHAYDYAGNTRAQDSDHVLCSLVQQIDGASLGKVGHVLDLPDFGRIFLAELLVDRGSFQLIMLRFELGCPVVGDASVVTARINGKTQP